jgi:hypothetical protein
MAAHVLAHLAPFLARHLTVLIGVRHVEVTKRSRLSLLQCHPTILVGVGHREHVPAETAAIRAAALQALAALRRALTAQLLTRLKLRRADCAVAVSVEPFEHPLATHGRSLGTGCASGIDFRTGQLPVAVGVEPLKALRRVVATLTVRPLGQPLAALRMKGLNFGLGDCTIAVRVDAGEMLLHLGGNLSARMNLVCPGIGDLGDGCAGEYRSGNATEKECVHRKLQMEKSQFP